MSEATRVYYAMLRGEASIHDYAAAVRRERRERAPHWFAALKRNIDRLAPPKESEGEWGEAPTLEDIQKLRPTATGEGGES